MLGVAAQPKDCATLQANNHVKNPVERGKRKVCAVRQVNHAMALLSREALNRPKASHPHPQRGSATVLYTIASC